MIGRNMSITRSPSHGAGTSVRGSRIPGTMNPMPSSRTLGNATTKKTLPG